MESIRTVQTAFRFREEMVRKMKMKARLRNISVNSYVEKLIESDLEGRSVFEEALSRIVLPEKISDEVMELSRHKMAFTEDELAADDKLAYILGK